MSNRPIAAACRKRSITSVSDKSRSAAKLTGLMRRRATSSAARMAFELRDQARAPFSGGYRFERGEAFVKQLFVNFRHSRSPRRTQQSRTFRREAPHLRPSSPVFLDELILALVAVFRPEAGQLKSLAASGHW